MYLSVYVLSRHAFGYISALKGSSYLGTSLFALALPP